MNQGATSTWVNVRYKLTVCYEYGITVCYEYNKVFHNDIILSYSLQIVWLIIIVTGLD